MSMNYPTISRTRDPGNGRSCAPHATGFSWLLPQRRSHIAGLPASGRRSSVCSIAQEDTRTALGGERGVRVRDAVRLEKPLAEVYRFWRRLENLPQFMTHLERVTELGDGRSHWIAKGPAGVRVEWDAEIINEAENKVIGWRSIPGGDVVTGRIGELRAWTG